jgi:hypothetical protein
MAFLFAFAREKKRGGDVRLATFISLAILGLNSLLVVFVNDHPSEYSRGGPIFESDGLALLAVSTILVVVVAALWGQQSWLGYALVPLTLAASIVGCVIGTAKLGGVTPGFEIPILRSSLRGWMRSVVQIAISLSNQLRGTASTPLS